MTEYVLVFSLVITLSFWKFNWVFLSLSLPDLLYGTTTSLHCPSASRLGLSSTQNWSMGWSSLFKLGTKRLTYFLNLRDRLKAALTLIFIINFLVLRFLSFYFASTIFLLLEAILFKLLPLIPCQLSNMRWKISAWFRSILVLSSSVLPLVLTFISLLIFINSFLIMTCYNVVLPSLLSLMVFFSLHKHLLLSSIPPLTIILLTICFFSLTPDPIFLSLLD